MASFQILEEIPREKLVDVTPQVFRPVCDFSRLKGATFTLIVFSSKKTVLSRIVSKALDSAASASNLVALAYALTEEGLGMLAQRNAAVFQLHGTFHWTDASYRGVTSDRKR